MGLALERTAALPWTAFSVIHDSVRQYGRDHCGTYAAAIAYYTLFSLVPLTLVVVSTLGLVIDPNRVVEFVFDLVPLEESAEVRTDIESAVRDARAASPGVLVLSTAILVWSASGMFGAVRRGVSVAYGGRGQPYLHGKLLDITLVPGVGLAMLLGLGLLTGMQIALQQLGGNRLGSLNGLPLFILGHGLVTLLTFGSVALLYRFLPEQRPGWREALWSAGIAAVLLEVTKAAAGYFLAHAPLVRDSALYASIGTALSLLFWVFVAASVLLYGGEFGRRVARPPGRTPSAPPAPAAGP